MGHYAEYLKNLIAPLGIYSFEEGTVSEAAVYALGSALDGIEEKLERAEREGLTVTAEEEGLRRAEALFARRPAAPTLQDRRAALAALAQIDGDSLTPEAIDRTLRGCGIRAEAHEIDRGHLRVIFPDVAGVPEGFEEIGPIVLDILPCHLEVEFYFLYITWAVCENMGLTWEQTENAQHT